MKQEALRLALDALETELSIDWTNNNEFNASAEKMYEAIAAIKKALAQTQEPVKDWVASHNAICALLRQAHDALALTSYPMKRTWVGLTDREMMDAIGLDDTPMESGRKIEQALKEKNSA